VTEISGNVKKKVISSQTYTEAPCLF